MKEARKKVVVADDEQFILSALREILSNDFEVYTATNGVEAAGIARSIHPNLIMLDILMPGTNGLEICRELKKDKATMGIPVIFLSAMTQTDDISKGFAAGGDAYIQKPFSAEKLLQKVKSVIEMAELKNSIYEETTEKKKV